MANFISRKLEKLKQKKTFAEYGYEVNAFHVDGFGKVEYAQWQHPFEKPKTINASSIEYYQKLVSPGATIVDIGAHTGDTTVLMALAVGKVGLVIGFEPNRYVYKVLKANSELNAKLTNIEPVCAAATAENGTFKFNYSDASFCNGGFLSQIENQNHKHDYTLEVRGINFEEYAENSIDPVALDKLELVKIDAEGYDKEIIKSISQLLKSKRPKLMVECYKKLNNEERAELWTVVDELGYDLFKIDGFEASSIDEKVKLELRNMNDEKHFEILAIPR